MVNLKIGQKKVLPPAFVDEALKAIGHNSGRASPLLPLAVDPKQRDRVQQLAYDATWQMVRAEDPAISGKWFQFAKTTQLILKYTKRAHTARKQTRRVK